MVVLSVVDVVGCEVWCRSRVTVTFGRIDCWWSLFLACCANDDGFCHLRLEVTHDICFFDVPRTVLR